MARWRGDIRLPRTLPRTRPAPRAAAFWVCGRVHDRWGASDQHVVERAQRSRTEERALERLAAAGILLIAAAGNEVDSTTAYPVGMTRWCRWRQSVRTGHGRPSPSTTWMSSSPGRACPCFPHFPPAAQVRAVLRRSALLLGPRGRDPWTGFGLVQARGGRPAQQRFVRHRLRHSRGQARQASSTTTGAWSLAPLPLRSSRSISAPITRAASAGEARTKSIRIPSRRGKRSWV